MYVDRHANASNECLINDVSRVFECSWHLLCFYAREYACVCACVRVCVCACVCLCVCVYIYIYTSMNVGTHADACNECLVNDVARVFKHSLQLFCLYAHVYACVRARARMCVCMRACVYIYMYTDRHADACNALLINDTSSSVYVARTCVVSMHVYIRVCVCVYTCAWVHVHIHTHCIPKRTYIYI